MFEAFEELIEETFESDLAHGRSLVDAFFVEVPGRADNSRGFIDQRRVGKINPYEVGRSTATENKDLLHYTTRTHQSVEERLGHQMSRSTRNFISLAEEAYQQIISSLRPPLIALGMDADILPPEESLAEEVVVMRLLNYLGGKESPTPDNNDSLAELHFDRSKLTAAVWSSAPGLVGGPAHNQISDSMLTVEDFEAMSVRALGSPIPARRDYFPFFFGAGFNYQMRDKYPEFANTPMLLHGVSQTDQNIGRKALVAFINERSDLHFGSPPVAEDRWSSIRSALSERQSRYGRGAVSISA